MTSLEAATLQSEVANIDIDELRSACEGKVLLPNKVERILGVAPRKAADLFDGGEIAGYRLGDNIVGHRRYLASSLLEYLINKKMFARLPLLLAALNGVLQDRLDDPCSISEERDCTSGIVAKILRVSPRMACKVMESMPGFYRLNQDRRVPLWGVIAHMEEKGYPKERIDELLPEPHLAMLGTQYEATLLNNNFKPSRGKDMVIATENPIKLGGILTKKSCFAVLVSETTARGMSLKPDAVAAMVADAIDANQEHAPHVLLGANGDLTENNADGYELVIPRTGDIIEQMRLAALEIHNLLHWKLPTNGEAHQD